MCAFASFFIACFVSQSSHGAQVQVCGCAMPMLDELSLFSSVHFCFVLVCVSFIL